KQDFFPDWLEEIDSDCESLQLHTTSNFKADHVYAFDSNCDDEATSSAIFMASLYPARSINGDALGPTYHLDILPEVPHYDTYHETDMFNPFVQEIKYSEQLVSNNDSYDELSSDNNVISYADYMVTIKNDAAQYVPPFEQTNDMILSVIEQIKSEVEQCNTVNQETKSMNESLTRRVNYTDASGSKLMSNTRNDRISRPSSRRKKNKVKDQLRKFKSSSNKNNFVLDCNANVKNVVVLNNTANAKSVKQKEKIQWKPNWKGLYHRGHRCVLTGIMFSVEEKTCLLTKSIPAVAPNAETRIRYSIAKNSLIRAYTNYYVHPFI
nr:hypothetical protein [Tanacetum cinerariifolium]